MILVLALLGALAEPDQALHEVEQQFALRSRADSEAALVALASRWPSSPAAGRALIWLGGLALGDDRLELAADRFLAARRFAGQLGALAERGLGDIDMKRGRFSRAAERYAAGLAQAETPSLRFELGEKQALAVRAHRRWLAELAAWLGLALALAWLGRGLRRQSPRLPAETLFVLPLAVLLTAMSWARDRAVFVALAWLGAGALLVCTVAFAAPPPPRGGRRLALDLAAAALASLALGYIAVRRAGILDAFAQSL